MKKLLTLALGIVAALGGFVDIGDLVFNAAAGAKFGYSLLWALVVGTIGIIIYSELAGRVVAVTKKTVFDLIREQYSPRLGFFTLAASMTGNILTCAAEVGGIALVLYLLSGYSYQLLVIIAVLALIAIIWFTPFEGLERLFGYLGVGLVVFIIVAIKTSPGLADVGHGLVPRNVSGSDVVTYWYYAVGLIAAALMPYEVYFYSSGGREENWHPEDASRTNRYNATLGFALGGVVAAGIMFTAANVFLPSGIQPETLGTTASAVAGSLGTAGLLIALLSMLFAIGGAALETAFAGAYTLSQYGQWPWQKSKPPLEVPRFTAAWIIILLLAAAIILLGIDPVTLTEYAVIFSVVVMPLTYIPIWRASRNKKLMGKYTSSRFLQAVSSVYLVIITIVALAAVPLLFITSRGQ